MPPKAKIAAPIDRPLSRAYLREFSGWSTAFPPGLSEPTSLRVMENMQVNRDGSLRVRPGMRYLSYSKAPGELEAPQASVPFGSTWRYLQTPYNDEVDYSGVSVDDSTWAVGSAPFSSRTTLHENWPQDWTPGVTNWDGNTALWVRRTLPSAESYTIEVRIDNGVVAYWNGVQVGAGSDGSQTSFVVNIDGSMIQASNMLALRARDWGQPSYLDVRITAAGATGGGGGVVTTAGGVASEWPLVGTHEAFYLADGTKAYLVAVRETDGSVGFRTLVADVNNSTMYALTHPLIDFDIPQPVEVLNFSADTTYVKYLQIDNKIFALSDNGEPMRVFKVGEHKEARALASIERPDWTSEDKLDVVHPDAAWITGREPIAERRNRVHNPSFETNKKGWREGPETLLRRPANPPVTPISGSRALRVESAPTRTNLAASPLHDVATTGIFGWGKGLGDEVVVADGAYLKVEMPAVKGLYFARSQLLPSVEAGTRYQVAYDNDDGAHVTPMCRVRFYGVNGAQVGSTVEFVLPNDGPRWASPAMTAPKGAVSMRLYIGGENQQNDATNVRAKNVVICPADESTAMFHGGSGANYFWTGAANASASVYHPPASVSLTSEKTVAAAGKALCGSLYIQAVPTARNATLTMRLYNKDGQKLDEATSGAVATSTSAWTRLVAADTAIPGKAIRADLRLSIPNVARGEYFYVDAALVETKVSTAGSYFDGSTPDTGIFQHSWRKVPHDSGSVRLEFPAGAAIPVAETRTADTLRASGGRAANPYNFGFFYTFNNEVGESAASRVTIVRASRAWSEWVWETPNALGEPSGTSTNDPEKCADQLVAIMPQEVFDEATAQGAISWSLYMFTWSNQDAAPVTALKVGTRALPDTATYDERGWIRVTPAQSDITDDAAIPSYGNRYNYSDPSKAGQGLVAADRMILVNDPTAAAVIRWSSNRMGEYTNFTASKGGGYKTLTSGNLYVPACVKLWQNPQSADTLTILCLGTDGHSTAYYMAPAQVTSQSDATSFMGFEETTATPGTTSPYGVEVLNNALYHPLDDQLMKSTASNYNITHKSMTDMIANRWAGLATKYWIVSAQLDNRLYYLVNNPMGYELEEGCKGNELWVYDAAAESGSWSRFLIQAHTLRKIEFGGKIYMSVLRPDGVYYLDPEYTVDDVVDPNRAVLQRAIPWKFETNTQGANRAHDAWAHLQQASIVLGNFTGTMRYGVKGWDVNGMAVDIAKETEDSKARPTDGLPWDIEDFLLIRRDMKEWQLYGESLPGVVSSGQVSLVQYRYAPVSVNVGYEYGSVETFEYTRNVVNGNNSVTTNGVPVPAIDTRRP